MVTVDFHTHTCYSADSLASPQEMLAACKHKGVDRLVITDHNTIEGALIAQDLDPERVIVGEEIMTQQGEILAVFVKENVPPNLPPLETIARLREQGAFISVSHPFDKIRKGHWELPALLEIAPLVDAVEAFNARCFWPSYNDKARRFAQQHRLLMTAGSDAHAAVELGAAMLYLPAFSNAGELRQALTQSEPRTHISGPWVHFFSRYARLIKRLGMNT